MSAEGRLGPLTSKGLTSEIRVKKSANCDGSLG